MYILGRFLSKLTLKTEIGLIVVIGLLLVISVFGYLGLTALGRSTDARLQERLSIARLVADYQDQMLSLALKRLEAAAGSMDAGGDFAAAPGCGGGKIRHADGSD